MLSAYPGTPRQLIWTANSPGPERRVLCIVPIGNALPVPVRNRRPNRSGRPASTPRCGPRRYAMIEQNISLADPNRALALFGPRDQYLRALKETLGVTLSHRDGQLRIQGEEPAVNKAAAIVEQLQTLLKERGELDPETVGGILAAAG